ncbi:MAG: ADP-ribose pyrophosphatase [Pirellulaceae bacterium]|jgi:ADP-ribose pyrophosphatase
MRPDGPQRIIAEGRFLRLIEQGGWEFVQRRNASGVVIVMALTADKEVIFVEQVRPPVGCRVIEFPAGLSGDLPHAKDEPLQFAALRELIEETGYEAASAKCVFTGPSSAGLTDEMASFYVTDAVVRTGEGGGVGNEKIKVHAIPLDEVEDWLDARQQDGCLVGARVFTGLYWLRRATQDV